MYEIELKAHVETYEITKKTIESFARFIGSKSKKDVYWQSTKTPSKEPVRIRIRHEEALFFDGTKNTSITVTYKKKEVRKANKSVSYEVNDEKEFSIDNREAFEAILIDSGFEIDIKKQKDVLQWEHKGVLLELCTICDLGHFLELEIVSDTNDEKTVNNATTLLKDLLLLCEIPLEKIENRYYSELLREKKV